MNRKESAAATRRALIDQAAQLLDGGGLDAVTLREVGARAGVSRGAPYRHFADKEGLLTAVAADGWSRLEDEMRELNADPGLSPLEKVRKALTTVVTLSRQQPHLYRLMFRPPEGDGDASAVSLAAQRMCDEFRGIVVGIADHEDAERYAAMLLTGVHGAAGLEMSGLLRTDKWQTTAEELTESLLALIDDAARRGHD
ncbi:TetR/AcrR family transcriptional regulator [Mycolicibacterium confluentis]|uniref:TetR family transcriptional regulator n=1 Tax=Mycolicibacterium confluentis TaxID=28047 RepID=A0A7I7XXJ9_9MYCO|nr:TetR/AcrR family transcriptional regulator [Mycolicibacterium confluentis]MCV7321857.1 TetR/AcrR family transcriptional regulator [Mycolicibacterium confluentis]ORV32113.1 transcriptional regulator [Mycolicibacterium confluentis]BBZ33673.1 TetR family transcriptional regulator [Mycolicibacterium confluentis]